MDFFPIDFTFWNVLYYIFIFCVCFYIGFQIYIYMNGLEYEIDCENHDQCFVFKDIEEMDEMYESEE